MTATINLSGRTAIVTGASNGIGRATAVLLAEHGATVLAADFRHLEENVERFEELGIAEIACDVRRESDLAAMIGEAVSSAIHPIFLIAAGLAVLGFLFALVLEEIKLANRMVPQGE